jgi:hypothetical protein
MSKKMLLLEYDAGYAQTIESISKDFIVENKLSSNEDVAPNGVPTVVFAVLQKYGVLNENNRVYSEKLLKREADRYLKECIPQKNTLLEANHPESTQINILNGAGLLTDVWWDGITLLGKIKLNLSRGFVEKGIVTTSGDQISNLMMNGIIVGVSSRGVGSLKKINGVNHVEDDYELICWDFVNKPSSKGSWVSTDMKNLTPYIDKTVKEEYKSTEKYSFNDKLSEYLSKFT